MRAVRLSISQPIRIATTQAGSLIVLVIDMINNVSIQEDDLGGVEYRDGLGRYIHIEPDGSEIYFTGAFRFSEFSQILAKMKELQG